MNKRVKMGTNYTGLFLLVAVISYIINIAVWVIGGSSLYSPNEYVEYVGIIVAFSYVVYLVMRLFLILFFILVIYNQFRDNRIFWAVLTLFLFAGTFVRDNGILVLLPALLIGSWYYFVYIEHKFDKKKERAKR